MVSRTNILHSLRLFWKHRVGGSLASDGNNHNIRSSIDSDILLPVSEDKTRERGTKGMKVFKLRNHWFTQDDQGRRKKFATEEEANEYAGIVPIIEEEDYYEPTEIDEWRDYDPDC